MRLSIEASAKIAKWAKRQGVSRSEAIRSARASVGEGSLDSRLRMKNQACPTCGFPLMKIDYYGEVLVGCIDCNYWGCPGDKKLMMEMQEDDLEALRASMRREHPPH